MTYAWDVTLVTYDRFPYLAEDDRLLAEALRALGLRVRPAVWNDPDVDWAASRLTVMRSMWDYFHHVEAFRAWLDRIESQTTLVNSASLARWNMDKRYLADLEARGIRCVPTRFCATSDPELPELPARWQEVVIKPTISGSAVGARRFTLPNENEAARAHLATLLERGEAMVQPFLPSVEAEGERSYVMLDGDFSHAYTKTAFSAGSAGGGGPTERPYLPSEGEIATAMRVLAAVPERTLYARVDLAAHDGEALVMEVELIEPALHFWLGAGSAGRLAAALAARVLTAARTAGL